MISKISSMPPLSKKVHRVCFSPLVVSPPIAIYSRVNDSLFFAATHRVVVMLCELRPKHPDNTQILKLLMLTLVSVCLWLMCSSSVINRSLPQTLENCLHRTIILGIHPSTRKHHGHSCRDFRHLIRRERRAPRRHKRHK